MKREHFIKQLYQVENNNLDLDHKWEISDGVRVSTLNAILKEYDISYYCLNIVDKIFDKYISTNRNYDALCYYALNDHMYLIDNLKKCR